MGNASSRLFAQGRPTCAPPARTLEVRKRQDTDPLKQYPPSPDGYGGTGVTAVVDASDGDVVERYAYDPYGKVTVLNGEDDADGGGVSDWSADADNVSDWDNRIGYCGYRLDPETGANGQGIMHVRWRMYMPPLGRWTSRDPLNQDRAGGGFLQRDPTIQYADGMNLYQYARSQPTRYLDPSGLACCDQCEWGKKRSQKVNEVRFRPAGRKMSPGAIDAAESGLNNMQIIATVYGIGNIVVAGTHIGLTDLTVEVVDYITGEGIAPDTDAMVDVIKGFDKKLMKREGVTIWVHVKYENCEWTRCYPWIWKGANDWVEKDKWHRCSAKGRDAPRGDISGFAYDDQKGIARAIGQCMKEALGTVK